MKFFLSTVISVLIFCASFSQKVSWNGDAVDVQLFKKEFENLQKKSPLPVADQLKNTQISLIQTGYLLCSVDTFYFDSANAKHQVYISVGSQFTWAQLTNHNIDEGYLSKAGFREQLINNQSINPKKISTFLTRILAQYENNGFPFARVFLTDATLLSSHQLKAKVAVEKGELIVIDTIVFTGDAKISESYLHRYLGLKPGMPYNEALFQQIDRNINNISFLQSAQPAQVSFSQKKARIEVFITKRNASSFNGLIGFLPDEETGEITISGDAKLELVNALGKGEELLLNWRRLKTNTQELVINTAIPYLFKTPLGVSADFEIYRRDSTFNTVTIRGGIQYYFKRGNYLEGFIESNESSTIANLDNQSTVGLPVNSSVQVLSYGMLYKAQFLDYKFNPTKGASFTLRASVGEKELIPPTAENTTAFDTIPLKSELYKAKTDISAYWPIIPKTTLKFRLQAGHIINDQLFTNELFRIGGINTLRGFDEEIIFASSYAIPSVEFRYLLEQNSYLSAFFDYAWYEQITTSQSVSDTPFGFGAGFSFETKAGIFSLFYALGKQFDNPVELRAGKVHFGFSSLF